MGLGELFKTETKIELIASRNDGNSHEVFKIEWI
jgi:hypothetical protein